MSLLPPCLLSLRFRQAGQALAIVFIVICKIRTVDLVSPSDLFCSWDVLLRWYIDWPTQELPDTVEVSKSRFGIFGYVFLVFRQGVQGCLKTRI